ncbi:MAG: bifunctional ornithine acetyltransferase/N-acetylglutamate synthase, partial [Chloroflexi bacterium]|nr:bifunctional ornithine acetyltransferase/N-acetylglutamate synthase [Chloroflexota bacterium]
MTSTSTNLLPPHLPLGFRASGVVAHIKKNGQPDLALIVSDSDCAGAALFTTNKVKAAPVLRDQAILRTHADRLRAVVINSGCANACTGAQGIQDCEDTARLVANALDDQHSPTTQSAGQPAPQQVFVMSTGVIGVNLPMDKLRAGIPAAVHELSTDGLGRAARAIMTTDTVPKIATTEVGGQDIDGEGTSRSPHSPYVISGIAKGSGMIHPNMATMLSVVMTDAAVDTETLAHALRFAADHSFHRISVDGDTSTNDTLLVLV